MPSITITAPTTQRDADKLKDLKFIVPNTEANLDFFFDSSYFVQSINEDHRFIVVRPFEGWVNTSDQHEGILYHVNEGGEIVADCG